MLLDLRLPVALRRCGLFLLTPVLSSYRVDVGGPVRESSLFCEDSDCDFGGARFGVSLTLGAAVKVAWASSDEGCWLKARGPAADDVPKSGGGGGGVDFDAAAVGDVSVRVADLSALPGEGGCVTRRVTSTVCNSLTLSSFCASAPLRRPSTTPASLDEPASLAGAAESWLAVAFGASAAPIVVVWLLAVTAVAAV